MSELTAVETLRAAAERLREHVGSLELSSVRGPWSVSAGPDDYPQGVTNVGVPIAVCTTYTSPAFPPAMANYIALMNPQVGAAVAEWLEAAARRQVAVERAADMVFGVAADALCDEVARTAWLAEASETHALAVARAILREGF